MHVLNLAALMPGGRFAVERAEAAGHEAVGRRGHAHRPAQFSISDYQFSISSVTVDLKKTATTPAYIRVEDPFHIQRVLPAADLAAAYGSADLCTTGAIPAPCLTLGKNTAPLDGRVWIEINKPKATTDAKYDPPVDLTFDCAISVVVEAVGAGSGIIVDNAIAASATVTASRTEGTFSATVIAGGEYKVTPATFECSTDGDTTGLGPYFDLISDTYPSTATANKDNSFHVDFPYLPNTKPPGGCGHTLGFGMTISERLQKGMKAQYTRDAFLGILQRLTNYPADPEAKAPHFKAVLNVVPKLPACPNGVDSIMTTAACGNWYLHKQLLANEISAFAGFAINAFQVDVNHKKAEYMVYQYQTKTGLVTDAELMEMQRYLDALNNLETTCPTTATTGTAGSTGARRRLGARRLSMR
ncbi:hypothetical protein HYH03_006690 [Edaphochlamys debaryana]|uniref:Uncharacterized protein n=1 Tax=Edaphochlamys debaryana TaxID=47281 RepID=A0A835YCN9_9CHLO|nr:hypothetical protein HYH03_006690 [Edaphochlamys debaryana]|eukprot:KAG2495079.1 hypothetical protein HYH03_006690 [Edaphochlamys debaryana]